MNEDLKWLAENVHEWSPSYPEMDRIFLRRSGKADYANSQGWPSGFYENGRKLYTENEWQAARDELSGKPGWDDAPEWAQWLCQTCVGVWFWCEAEQCISGGGWDAINGEKELEKAGAGRVLGDWRNTLERRPVEPPTHENHRCIMTPAVEPKQWRGPEDGSPPIGTEVKYPSGCGVVMLDADVNGVIITLEDGEYKRVAACACKPLPTEEDKAVEDMASLLGFPECPATQQVCRDLYRAGYRKQESE